MEYLSHVVLFMVSMRNYEILENLCTKLKSLGIDPRTLTKAIGIFLIIILLVGLMVMFPILLKIVAIMVVCIFLTALIYLMLEWKKQ